MKLLIEKLFMNSERITSLDNLLNIVRYFGALKLRLLSIQKLWIWQCFSNLFVYGFLTKSYTRNHVQAICIIKNAYKVVIN